MFGKKSEETENPIERLKDRGLTCGKIKSMINKQMSDAKQDRADANMLKTLGFEKQGEYQENIAKAQEKAASALREVKRKLCPLK
jgi:DNA-binding transcriptional MerR regulator